MSSFWTVSRMLFLNSSMNHESAMHFHFVAAAKFFFCRVREEHFIVSASEIVKKKIVQTKKKFSLETARLFISLWSLLGKKLLFLTKLDLCTAVDNFSPWPSSTPQSER